MDDMTPARRHASVTRSARGWCAATSPNTVTHQDAVSAGAPCRLQGAALCFVRCAGRSTHIAFTPRALLGHPRTWRATPSANSHSLNSRTHPHSPRASRRLVRRSTPDVVGCARRAQSRHFAPALLLHACPVRCTGSGWTPDPNVGCRAPLPRLRRARGRACFGVGAETRSRRLGSARSASVRCDRAWGAGAHRSPNFAGAAIRAGHVHRAAGAARCTCCGGPQHAAVTTNAPQPPTETTDETASQQYRNAR